MFLNLTCDSYGKVGEDGTPTDPAGYDYQRAARDAIHFPALFDRLIQNLRRYLGYDVQYCHQASTDAQLAHAARLAEALRYEPCSPSCELAPLWHSAPQRAPRPDTRTVSKQSPPARNLGFAAS
jgi:hypothetical protein